MSSFLNLMNHGGGSMWVIAVFSVVAIAVAIERALSQYQFIARAKLLASNVNQALAKGSTADGRSACERSISPLADVFLVGFAKVGKHRDEFVWAAVHRERQRLVAGLRAKLWVLGTIGATAPFVGLFGTVVGIMDAMRLFEGDVSKVLGPISQALVVTAAGILVAVEAVILYNYFGQRAAKAAAETKLLADEFLETLIEANGGAQGGAAADSAGAKA